MGYCDECTHGGPPLDLVEDVLDLVEVFQSKVLSAKLFDLPPGVAHFRQDQHAADLKTLACLVQQPEYTKLRCADIARIFLSEAVDCNHRREAIAQAWTCTALLLSAASTGALPKGEDNVPVVIQDLAAEADRDLASVLWRFTPCDCVTAPQATHLPWTAMRTAGAQHVKCKDWASAASCYVQALTMLEAAEKTETAISAATCFTSRGPKSLNQVKAERAKVLSNLSLCRLSLGEAEAALEAGVAAAEANPEFAKAYGRQVLALEALGRPASECQTAAENAVRVARSQKESQAEYLAMLGRFRKPTEASSAAAA